ncbi:hypothetical protein [Aquisphaera insulae]|uniref:hypothetical protein n=1 Tax=Aquisphaera insulae TaxID=2712864 RepID=UPI0013EA60A6|nr:hypothetical protein [Aquisphaera insulae]
MESCIWILLAAGVATTAVRLSWAGPRAILVTAAAWASLPWLCGDRIAATSAAGLLAWASGPDRVGALATFVVVEAVAGGLAAIHLAGSDDADVGATRPGSWGSWLAAVVPSPALAFGLIGVQTSLFHRGSGWGFSTISAGLSAAAFAAIVALAWAWRLARPDPRRRASAAVPLFAALFVLGAATVPLLDRRPHGARPPQLDVKSLVFLAVLTTVGAGAGAIVRLVRSRAIRKREEVS